MGMTRILWMSIIYWALESHPVSSGQSPTENSGDSCILESGVFCSSYFYAKKSEVSWPLNLLLGEMSLPMGEFSGCTGTPQLLSYSTSQLFPVPTLLALLDPSPGPLRLYILLLQSLRTARNMGPVPASQDSERRGRRKEWCWALCVHSLPPPHTRLLVDVDNIEVLKLRKKREWIQLNSLGQLNCFDYSMTF